MARSEDTRPTTEEPTISSVNTPLVLALACMSIRLVLSVFWKPTMWGDTPTYVAMAEYIKSWDFSGYLAVRPPGYPLLLLLGGLDFRAIWLIQSFLGIGISVMLYSLTYDQTRSRPWAFAAGLSYSLSINGLLFEASILTETLSTFLLMLSVWLVIRALRPTRHHLLWHGSAATVAAFAALTRPLLLFLGPLCLLVLLRSWSGVRLPLAPRLKRAVAFAVPWILLVGGWSLFNLVKVDYFGVTTLGGYNLTHHTGAFIELAPQRYATIKRVYLRHRDQQMAAFGTYRNTINVAVWDLLKETGLSYVDMSRTLSRMSLELMAAHPYLYLKSVTQAWIPFWTQNFYFVADPRPGLQQRVWWLERWVLVSAGSIFLALSLNALYSLTGGRRTKPISNHALLPIAVVVVGSLAQALGEFGEPERNSIPFQPLILLVVVVWLHSTFHRARPKPPLLELPRFRGHPIVGGKEDVHDVDEPSPVLAGVPPSDRQTGSQRADARGARTSLRAVGPVHPELDASG